MNNEEKEARYLITILEGKKFTAQGEALRTYIEELNKNINKLINYIAIRENKTYEDICKEFELGE